MLTGLETFFPLTVPAAVKWLKDHGFREEEDGKGLSHPLLHGWVHVGQPPWNCLEWCATVEIQVNDELKQYETKTSRNLFEVLEEAIELAFCAIGGKNAERSEKAKK
ncbi:MAG: hypothetical protein J6Y62_04615 [Clostridia bacterium]|nr:hypothetical protein [Clostridia bacterium]